MAQTIHDPIAEQNLKETQQILQIARLYYEEKWMQKTIAKELGISEGMVSRLLRDAETKGIVEHKINLPLVDVIQQEMCNNLAEGIKRVAVVPDGVGERTKNIGNIAPHAAEMLLRCILDHKKENISLVISCGETLREIMDILLDRLEKDLDLRDQFEKKNLTVLPTTLWADDCVSPEYPHSLVTAFAVRARRLLRRSDCVTAIAPILPNGYYSMDPSDQLTFMKCHGITENLQRIRNADIFVTGLGITDDKVYRKLLGQLKIKGLDVNKLIDDYPSEVCYIPVNLDGEQHPVISKRIVGITPQELKALSRDSKRTVFGVAGGIKRDKVNSLLDAGTANVYCLDVGVCRAWLEHRKKP